MIGVSIQKKHILIYTAILLVSILFCLILKLSLERIDKDQGLGKSMTGVHGMKNMSVTSESIYDVASKQYIEAPFLKSYFHFLPKSEDSYLAAQSVVTLVYKGDVNQINLLLKIFGPEKIIKKLFGESNHSQAFDCHMTAHQIGRIYYSLVGTQALQKFIPLCGSGYFHAVIGMYMKEKGAKYFLPYMTALCDNLKNNFERTQCYHASGHGLMAVTNNNLPKAIGMCGEYKIDFEKDNCYAGAFMENDGSLMGDSAVPIKTKWASLDPNYPCNIFADNLPAARACYALHFPLAALYIMKDPDILKLAPLCQKIEDKNLASACFFGFGMTMASRTNYNIEKTVSACGLAPDINGYQASCLQGGEMLTLGYWGSDIKDQGKKFCDTVPIKYKENCLGTLSHQMNLIQN